MAEISPELAERMATFVRACAAGFHMHGVNDSGLTKEVLVTSAQSIARDLPKPVDPDLILARKLVAETSPGKGGPGYDEAVIAGEHDIGWDVRVTLAAIKHGRELERRS